MIPYLTPLTAAQLQAEGLDAKWRFGMADRVKFFEIDALNHVNNTVYLRWFEALRVHYMIDYGLSAYRAGDPTLVVKSVTAGFHAPMFMGESYIVTARTTAFRRTSFTMEYAVHAPDLRAEGTALVVMLTPDSSAKFPLTEAVRHAFTTRDGARAEG